MRVWSQEFLEYFALFCFCRKAWRAILPAVQLEPIIAHEMFHVRGRDNLAAAMHTVVQALFWFHPLVWWLGNRLVDERERACDEAVLQSGHDPADYAEGILKVCKSNLMMPACVAGSIRIQSQETNRGHYGKSWNPTVSLLERNCCSPLREQEF